MAGSKISGLKARDTILARNPNHYQEIGRIGGKLGKTGGFYQNRELARTAGAKGGAIGKRGSAKFKGLPVDYVEPAWEAPKKRWQRILRRTI